MKNVLAKVVKNINIVMVSSDNKKPVIGITLDYVDDGDKNKYSDFPWYGLRRNYSDIIEKNGGIPLFLPFESYKSNKKEIFKIIDGLLIPGGDADVPPELYQEKVKFDTNPAIVRSENEKKLLEITLDMDMPILGICHGMQLLNVVLGGSLYQSILLEVPNAIDHKQKISRKKTCHDINIVEGTKLYSIINKTNFRINSNHRQAIKTLGNGLAVSGYCTEDNVVEAIESTRHKFVMGLEWHPEMEASEKEDNLIFNAFIKAASIFSACKD